MVTDKIESCIETDFKPVTEKMMKWIPQEQGMRSELIFTALTRESNRYRLVRLAARATRILHWPNTRIQDTMNDALQKLAGCRPRVATETQPS